MFFTRHDLICHVFESMAQQAEGSYSVTHI